MKYCIEESFAFIKNDNEWLKKLLIGSGISFAAIFLFLAPPLIAGFSKMFGLAAAVEIGVCWLVGFVLLLGVSGFCIQFGHDRIFDSTAKLPCWQDFWRFVFLGLKSALGSLMFYLPVIALGIVLGIFDAASKASGHGTHSAASFITECVYNLFYFGLLFVYFAFNANFVKDFNILSYVNIPAAYKRLKGRENFVNYLILVGLILALGFVFNLSAIILCITVIGILLLPFAAIYIQLVSIDITAQFLKITDDEQ